MNELQNFNFNGNQLRTILINNEPFFVGKDAAVAIGYKNFRDALKAHVKEKYKRESRITTPSGTQTFTVISEPGLYQLAGESKLSSAEPFQDWVYEEVLPTIRKHGAYMTSEVIEKTLTSPDFIIKLATQLKTEQEKTAMLSQQVAESRPKADYYDRILKSKSLVTISQIADDYGMTAQALNKMLYELQIQHKVGGQWLLYAKHKNHGYTFSDTTILPNYNKGGEKVVMNTKWTQKGRIFIYNVLKSEGILPTIEKKDAA